MRFEEQPSMLSGAVTEERVLSAEQKRQRVIRLLTGSLVCLVVIAVCLVLMVLAFDWLTSGLQDAPKQSINAGLIRLL